MITNEVPSPSLIRRAYDAWSWIYDLVASPLERGPRLTAWRELAVQPGERVLDAGAGTGSMLWRLSGSVGSRGCAIGIDFSSGMLRKASGAIQSRSSTAWLAAADVRRMPFRTAFFDAVYSAYLLDLLSEEDIRVALIELRRVLRPGGRIAVVNMTKKDTPRWVWLEGLYRLLPAQGQAWLLGACRPVFLGEAMREAGFQDVSRRFVPGVIASEIISGVNGGLE